MTTFQAVIAIALIFVIACIAFVVVNTWFPQRDERSATTQTVKEKYEPGELKSKQDEKLRLKLIRQFHGVE